MSLPFRNPVFVGLDTHDRDEAERLAHSLAPEVGGIKIGLEFFYAFGEAGYRSVARTGAPVFLDLKMHDIPNTVAGGMRGLLKLNPAIINVHAGGGVAMMRAALDAVQETAPEQRPWVIGVTVLTSLDTGDLTQMGIGGDPLEHTLRLAHNAQKAGLDGVVCSAHEIERLRQECGPDFRLVVPGLRPEGAPRDDQKRVTTPPQALALGADILVITRPVIKAGNPAEAARKIVAGLQREERKQEENR